MINESIPSGEELAKSPAKAEDVKRKRRKPSHIASDASTDENDIPEVPFVPYVEGLRSDIRQRREAKERAERRLIPAADQQSKDKKTKTSLESAVGQDLENICTPRNQRKERPKNKRKIKTPQNLKDFIFKKF